MFLHYSCKALDAESEATVQDAIDEMLKKGKKDISNKSSMTVIIVAHRLSTVRNADLICVVEAGRVVEQGRHDDLIMNEGGPYSNLINRQMKAQKTLEGDETSLEMGLLE